jgi:hypothetical protein
MVLTRRSFLALPVSLALVALGRASTARAQRASQYVADVGILFNLLRFHVEGTIRESVDRSKRRYDVTIRGDGRGITNRVESVGILRDDRWVPLRTHSRFQVYGRESRLDISYDHDRRTVMYRARSETFLLRRTRLVDDVVHLPDGVSVDDAVSAVLNYADGRWTPHPDGTLRTHVVRRRRTPGEGPDDVEPHYTAELVPFVAQVARDRETGQPTAIFDLTPFSSWAREDRPGRIVFGPNRRPESVATSLIFGTSVAVRFVWAPA